MGKYEDVFEDIVRYHINDYNLCNEDDKIDLTDREIKRITHDLIYRAEPMWEYIHETVDLFVGDILLERERESDK